MAVASFDKRGVGGSSGYWQDAGISEQADDAIAALELLGSRGATRPIGLFGHSQGGWVVLEAARRGARAELIVVNSGPGVSPAIQDRFSMGNTARRAGYTPEKVDALLGAFDVVAELLRSEAEFAEAQTHLAELDAEAGPLALSFISGEHEWQLAGKLLDHDPRPAMRAITVPVLALFGADDEVVPVDASAAVFRDQVRPELLTVAVLAGGNHRIQTGEPPRLVDNYADTLIRFITS